MSISTVPYLYSSNCVFPVTISLNQLVNLHVSHPSFISNCIFCIIYQCYQIFVYQVKFHSNKTWAKCQYTFDRFDLWERPTDGLLVHGTTPHQKIARSTVREWRTVYFDDDGPGSGPIFMCMLGLGLQLGLSWAYSCFSLR